MHNLNRIIAAISDVPAAIRLETSQLKSPRGTRLEVQHESSGFWLECPESPEDNQTETGFLRHP